MKTLILFVSLSFVSSFAHAAAPNCTTADGVKFSAVYNIEQEAICNSDYLIIGGVKIAGDPASGCSDLVNFRGTDGTKLTLSANGLGTLFYKGKIVSVNCN
jgi:hypothetical protein